MKKFILLLLFLGFNFSAIYPDALSSASTLSPLFLANAETDTLFRNPAELPLYDNLFGGSFSYGINDSKFSGTFILHLPDFGAGDMAFSAETFGTDFTQNIVWVEDTSEDSGGHFALSQGGGKFLFTWAKKTRFMTIGANMKMLFLNEDKTQRGIGFDLGAYITPFEELFLGAAVTDFGSTILRDTANNPVSTIKQVVRLSAAVISGKDMGLSVGFPLDLLDDIKQDPNNAWKRLTFQGNKTLGDVLSISAGYNTKDIYGNISMKLSDFFSVGISGYHDVYSSTDKPFYIPDKFMLSFSYALSFQTAKELSDAAAKAGSDISNSWIDYPLIMWTKPWYRTSRHQIRRERQINNNLNRMERRIQELEEEIDRKDELEDLNDEIKDINQELKILKVQLRNTNDDDEFDLISAKIERLLQKKKRLNTQKKQLY